MNVCGSMPSECRIILAQLFKVFETCSTVMFFLKSIQLWESVFSICTVHFMSNQVMCNLHYQRSQFSNSGFLTGGAPGWCTDWLIVRIMYTLIGDCDFVDEFEYLLNNWILMNLNLNFHWQIERRENCKLHWICRILLVVDLNKLNLLVHVLNVWMHHQANFTENKRVFVTVVQTEKWNKYYKITKIKKYIISYLFIEFI